MGSRPSRVGELAASIQEHTAIVENHLIERGLPLPSLDVNIPAMLDLPADIAYSRQLVIDATEELQVLMYGPMPFLFRQMTQKACSTQYPDPA